MTYSVILFSSAFHVSENNMASFGEQIISTKDLSDSGLQKDTRPPSAEKKSLMEHSNSTIHWFAQCGDDRDSNNEAAIRDRDEKLRLAKERQNEERQRKIEELRAQAEAAQKYREQKEEERRRRIEELRNRDNDRRQQVEERKKAIIEAEKERREYILRKNQERDARLDTKKRNERSSIVFAFGSSTPRLLHPAELGNVSPSTYWGNRRSTSITNVSYTGAPLTRRSSERELADGPKKRATSAGGIDRQNEDRRLKSTSMYEVFNWGYSNDEPPKRFPLSIAGGDINIDGPPVNESIRKITKEESTDSPPVSYRSVARRKTDLMPTIPSPRESSFGSRTSLYSHTPRTPGRAVSMTRLDQLAQPIRRNGEHIRAVIERERQQAEYGLLIASSSTSPNTYTQTSPTTTIRSITSSGNNKSMSRSMTHLAGSKSTIKQSHNNDSGSMLRPLRKKDTSKSMMQLTNANRNSSSTTTTTTTTTTKKYIRSSKFDRKDDAPSSLTSTGSRSGDVTPGGSINTSRPGSAMSTSTTASGLVQRRSAPMPRKPRPASIAVTGVTLIDANKQKKEKPPLPRMQSTPKRNIMSNSIAAIKVSSSSDSNNKQTERKTLVKKETPAQKPKPIQLESNTTSINNHTPSKMAVSVSEKSDKSKDISVAPATTEIHQTKEQKEAINTEKTEIKKEIEKADVKVVSENKNKLVDVPMADTVSTEVIQPIQQQQQQKPKAQSPPEVLPQPQLEQVSQLVQQDVSANKNIVEIVDEKADNDTEKEKTTTPPKEVVVENDKRELSVERQDNEMTASMIAKSKITTEEEAKAALAERRRLAREEAERQAELERQRIETERLAEIQRQVEEEERQRKFEEDTLRMAEEQRKSEEERLLQAIEEAKKRDEAEKVKREEEEKQKIEREEAEKKAKEEAEKQRLELAERLQREEKEREERRKRVEAIMSRTRAKGGNATPNSTPTKDNDSSKTDDKDDKQVPENTEKLTSDTNDQNQQQNVISNSTEINQNEQLSDSMVDNNKTVVVQQAEQEQQQQQQNLNQEHPIMEQNAYEKSVTDKENALINSFSNMIVDEQSKNYQNFQNNTLMSHVTNGKVVEQQLKPQTNDIVTHSIANGNGHSENINKNDTLVNIAPASLTGQLIDFSIESQQITDAVNFNNNNSMLNTSTAATTLVTSDSHENREISLL